MVRRAEFRQGELYDTESSPHVTCAKAVSKLLQLRQLRTRYLHDEHRLRCNAVPPDLNPFRSAAVSAGAKPNVPPPARHTIPSNISGPGRTSGAYCPSPYGNMCKRKH
jgi:hypothetical protein